MATIINNPDSGGDNSGNGMGMLIGIIVLVLVVIIFIVYGLPAIRGNSKSDGTTVNVPDQIDVNVNPGSGNQ